METPDLTTTPTARKRAGAVCPTHGIVHPRSNAAAKRALKAAVLALHGPHCVYCGDYVADEAAEMDRIAASCIYHVSNCVPACKACNNRRNRKGHEGALATVAQDYERLRGAVANASMQPYRGPYRDVATHVATVLAQCTTLAQCEGA